jgi:2-keto-4-pentenoate hydratase/2-oxohepta-3-ene-1,7-dioic acid hydratase in catechol pathway
MKIGNVRMNGRIEAAVSTAGGVVPVSRLRGFSSGGRTVTTDDIIADQEMMETIRGSLKDGQSKTLPENTFEYAPVVTRPQKILCIGLNYRSHIKETNDSIPETPVIFSKYSNALAASGDTIGIPEATRQLDYEGELGMVIGSTGRNIPESDALEYVFGYFIGNDLSARDLQFRTSQWLLGKSCDSFYPCGPFITTADEVPDPQKLKIRTRLNGEVRQDSDTSYMIFSCTFLVSYISKFMTLYPGDIISTGTPEGVILGMPEDRRTWIRKGDVVTVEIEGLGILENTFA